MKEAYDSNAKGSDVDPKTMVFDDTAKCFIEIPKNINGFINQNPNSFQESPNFKSFFKMVPELNQEKVFNSLTNSELINTTGKWMKFISDSCFKGGVHYIELLNTKNFKNVKLSLRKISKKGNVDFPLKIDGMFISDSLTLKIDLEANIFSAISGCNNHSREVEIKGIRFKLIVELENIGDNVCLNQCYLFRGQNNVWKWNIHLFDNKFMTLVQDWIFFQNFLKPDEKTMEKAIQEKLKNNPFEKYIYDDSLKILAVLVPKSGKEIKKTYQEKDLISQPVLKNVIKCVFQGISIKNELQWTAINDFIEKNKNELCSSVKSDHLKDILPISTGIRKIEKTFDCSASSLNVKYLSKPDALLISNGDQKLKIIRQKSKNGSFIVSPYIFDASRVNFILSSQEYELLFKSFNWRNLIQSLHFSQKEIQNIEKLFISLRNVNNICTDGENFFFALPANQVQTLVEKIFEYLNLQIHKNYSFNRLNDEIVVEKVSEEKVEENLNSNISFSEINLGDFFDEATEHPAIIDNSQTKAHAESFFKNQFEILPSEFDVYFHCIFKIEEALFLQSNEYRTTHIHASRGHTAFGRLFSYLSNDLPLEQVKKIADFGIYIKSSLTSEFQHFLHDQHPYSNFSDQNTSSKLLNSYLNMNSNPHISPFPVGNIELNFSISHLPFIYVSEKIENLFVISEGKFIACLSENKSLKIFSTIFGLTEVFKANLAKKFSWTSPTSFESIFQNSIVEINESIDNEFANVSKNEEKNIDNENKIDKIMLDTLYTMGFSLELARKALAEVNSSSLDDAVHKLLTLKEETFKTPEKHQTKFSQMQLKPEWNCGICSYANFIEFEDENPNVCKICESIAGQDAYFDDVEEEIIKDIPIEEKRIVQSDIVLESSDQILDINIIQSWHENPLQPYFIVFLFKRHNKVGLLVSRIAFSEPLLEKLIVQNPKSKSFISTLTFSELKRGFLEFDLGNELKGGHFEKICGIVPHIQQLPLLVETNRQLLFLSENKIKKNIFSNCFQIFNDQCEQKIHIYAVDEKEVDQILLQNNAQNYCSSDFVLTKEKEFNCDQIKQIEFSDYCDLYVLKKSSIVVYNQNFERINEISFPTDNLEKVLNFSLRKFSLLFKDKRIIEETLEIELIHSQKDLIKSLIIQDSQKSETNQEINFVDPQTLLKYFKTQSKIIFQQGLSSNFLIFPNTSDHIYSSYFHVINKNLPSFVEISLYEKSKGFNIYVEAFLKICKHKKAIQNLIFSPSQIFQKNLNGFANCYDQLALRLVSFRGASLSQEHRVSQMLINDGEFFSTKTPFHLFVFENLYEQVMKIKKFSFRIPETFRREGLIEEVLVFVFDDLMLLNQFANFTSMSSITSETGLKNGCFAIIEPCSIVNLRNAIKGELSEELEVARFGRYVAFLPLKGVKVIPKDESNMDCIQYFSVEGEYVLEKDITDHSQGILPEMDSSMQLFDDFQFKIEYSDKEIEVKKTRIIVAQENQNEFIVRVVASVQLIEDVFQNLKISFLPCSEDIQMISGRVSLSNVSHSLIMQIKEQIKDGSSERLISLFQLYNKEIIEKDEIKKSDFHNLIDLLLYILDHFDGQAIASLLKINFQCLIEKFILCCNNTRMIGCSRFLLEKLFSFKVSHSFFYNMLSEIIEKLPLPDLSYAGLQNFWEITIKYLDSVEKKTYLLLMKQIVFHISLTTEKVKSLTSPLNHILKTLNFKDSIDGFPVFHLNSANESSSLKQIQEKAQANNHFMDSQSVISWSGFVHLERYFADFYLNCVDLIKLEQIQIRLPKLSPLVKLGFTISVFDPENSVFKTLKNRIFSEDFSHFTSSRERTKDSSKLSYFDLGFSFSNIKDPIKLIRVQFKIGNFSIFQTSDIESLFSEFVIYGFPIQSITTKSSLEPQKLLHIQQKLIPNLERMTNMYFLHLKNKMMNASPTKSKITEIIEIKEHKKLELELESKQKALEVHNKKDQEVEYKISMNQSDEISKLKDHLEDKLLNVGIDDLRNKTGVENLINQYVSQCNQNILNSAFNWDKSLSFWTSNLYLIIKILKKLTLNKISEEMIQISLEKMTSISIRLFFDLFFMEPSNRDQGIQEFLTESVQKLPEEHQDRILQEIMAEFLDLPEITYVTKIEPLIECLQIAKLFSRINWIYLLEKIITMINRSSHELSEKESKELLLTCSFLNASSKKNQNFSQELIDKVQKVTIWILENKLEHISPIFEDSIVVLTEIFFKSLYPDSNSEIIIDPEMLKIILKYTSQNEMFSRIDKTLADFIKTMTKIPSQSPLISKYRHISFIFKTTLISFISENIIEKNDQATNKTSEILFFALTHLQSIEDLIILLTSKNEDEDKKDTKDIKELQKKHSKHEALFNVMESNTELQDFMKNVLNFMTTCNIYDNTLVSIITNFSINEQVQPSALFGLVRYAMTQCQSTRYTLLHDLTQRFNEIHKKLKTSKIRNAARDFSSTTMELLIELLQNHQNKLHEETNLAHFAINITLHIINENDSKAIANEPCKLAVRPQIIVPLFSYSIKLLTKFFNLGGVENFTNFPEKDVSLLELLCNLIHIILRGVDDSHTPILSFLVQNFRSIRENSPDLQLDESFKLLSAWSLCNFSVTTPEIKSVIGPLLKKLHTDVNNLYTEFFKKEEAAKVILNSICFNFKKLHFILHEKLHKRQLGYQAVYMNENAIEFLETIIKAISENRSLARHFLLQNKGLELIFEVLNRSTFSSTKVSQDNSFFSKLLQFKENDAKKLKSDPSKAQISLIKEKSQFEEEFGNKIINITIDKSISNGTTVRDWSINKIGKSASIYNTGIPNNKKSITLRFKCNTEFELRTFRLSVTVARSENYLVVGPPPYIHLYAIREDEKKETRKIYLGELKRVTDSGYLAFNAMVYVLNMNKLFGEDFELSINRLRHIRELKEFEVVIGRPEFTVIDKISPLCNRTLTAVNVSINFISMEGFAHQKIDLDSIFNYRVQNSFFRFLKILFNSEACSTSMDEYFNIVNDQSQTKIYDLIEAQLNPIMEGFDEKMGKFLLTLAEKNNQLANTIFSFLMRHLERKPAFFLLIDRILRKTRSYKYLFEFLEYGRNKLISDQTSLSHFLSVIVNYITFEMNSLKSDGYQSKIILPIDEKFYRSVVNAHIKNPFNYQIERFLTVIPSYMMEDKLYNIFPASLMKKESLVIDFDELTHSPIETGIQFLNILAEKVNSDKLVCSHILAYISTRSNKAKQIILAENMIERVSQMIIQNNSPLKIELLLFIQALSSISEFYEKIITLNIDKFLLEYLEENFAKEAFKRNAESVNILLMTIFLLFCKEINRIQELENQLFEMLKRYKNDSYFIEKILLPFFEFEQTSKVMLVYKKDHPIIKSLSNRETSLQQQKQSNIKLNSNFMSSTSIKHLCSQLIFLVDEKTERTMKDFEWLKSLEVNDMNEEFFEIFESKMYISKPSLLLLNVDNNGVSGVFGIFIPEAFIPHPDPNETLAYVPNNDNAFLFWYSEDHKIHYKIPLEKGDKFLKYQILDSCKCLTLLYDGNEKLVLSTSPDYPSSIDLYQMRPISQDNIPDFEFPYDCLINGFEIFQLQVKNDEKTETSNDIGSEILMGSYIGVPFVNVYLSMYEEYPYFDLPDQIPLKSLQNIFGTLYFSESLKNQLVGTSGFSKLQIDTGKEISLPKKSAFTGLYSPLFPLFEVFLEKGGIQYVIETIIKNNKLSFLKTKNLIESWEKLMNDLLELQKIERFLSSMTQNRNFLVIIFELFIGHPTSDRNWEEAEFNINCLIFEKLTSILEHSDTQKTRMIFFEKNVLQKLLSKLHNLTFDIVRVYKPENETKDVIIPQNTLQQDEPLLKEVKKRKGVGYEKEGSGKKWIINDYLAKKKQRNELIVNLLQLFVKLFSIPLEESQGEEMKISKMKESWFGMIAESCLLPMLEGAFKSSSLHEMCKEYEVYQQYCEILLTIGKCENLKNLLLHLPSVYKPVQIESILSILKKQEDNITLFKNFAKSKKTNGSNVEEKVQSLELGNIILETIETIKTFYPKEFEGDKEEEYEMLSENTIQEISQLPINEKYKIAFKTMRFGLVDFRSSNEKNFDHHYATSIASDSKGSSQTRAVRLAQEIADLSSSLPIDSYNAISVRADSERLDVIKAIIAGAENTPYANGLFEYHVYLPSEYPTQPPKCNLETTGKSDVRFNPNLYSCGKVCLSLLGTWRGVASENWDPKISNLLQLLLSIQSVVMSEEVYFNEPGYEGEIGTEEGEKKNEGYSNIVRLCNIKHAMIKQIKTPPNGFEELVRRHFYIKHEIVLRECGKWVKYAEVRPCTYGGLISDHNHKYASRFSQNNKAYITELKTAIIELEKTLKELVESCDPKTIFAAKRLLGNPVKKATKKKKETKSNVVSLQEKIDTSWDDFHTFQKFDADDKKVADRWSRYIGAMGIEAVKKQTIANVVIVGINSLGLEISKNIVLSGVNTLTLIDWKELHESDLLGNFYVSKDDIGKNRAFCVKDKLQQLNFYVKLEAETLKEDIIPNCLPMATIVIIAETFLPKIQNIIDFLQKQKIKIIFADNFGVYSRIFIDFGSEFTVNDRDGEEPSECYIKDINIEKNTITLFDKSFNQLRDNDFIVLSEIESKNEKEDLQNLNGSIHKIKKMHKITEIEVEDLSKFNIYGRNGKIKELKVPISHKFRPFSELNLKNFQDFLDENLSFYDFIKLDNIPLSCQAFLLKELFEKENNKDMRSSEWDKVEEFFTKQELQNEKLLNFFKRFYATSQGRIHSLDAFIGGVIAQQAIIGITNKFTPIHQLFCIDIEEILETDLYNSPIEYFKEQNQEMIESNDKYKFLSFLIGKELMKSVKESKLFMVGAGAIGCELLKNCVMLGLGCQNEGRITLTDPDFIELSNLNRQFLFREKHISKPKSTVATSVVQTMNADYNGRIHASLEKVCEETEDIFDDFFIKNQSFCLNALDNVKARVYMDKRCVRNHIPLLESGTLGPKGHVQVILPRQTENYSQVRDANEEQNIPVCTLKMFPEEPIHCMEWAKDRFETLFGQNPRSLIRVIEEFLHKEDVSAIDLKIRKTALKFLNKRPHSFEDALIFARKAYQNWFSNKIRQLLHVYPLDFKTKEGKLFWTLPKRPPIPQVFSTNSCIDMKFIISYATLLCRVWGIKEVKLNDESLSNQLKKYIEVEWKPKDSDISKIKKEVEKMEKKEQKGEQKEEQKEENSLDKDELYHTEELNKQLKQVDAKNFLKAIQPEVFEKDTDNNGHVDFIHSLTCLRSKNYKLKEMDWMSVKLKAGRIVPALATTTAAIAGLQALEAIKILKNGKLDSFKNCFLNLAIPYLTLSEPGSAQKFTIHKDLIVTVWDQWNFSFDEKKQSTFGDLLKYIESTYKLIIIDVLKDNKPVFLSALNERKSFEKVRLADLLELEKGDSCYISIVCKLQLNDENPLEQIPLVKVEFK